MATMTTEVVFKTSVTIETEKGSNLITVSFPHDGKRIHMDLWAAQAIEFADYLIEAVREAV